MTAVAGATVAALTVGMTSPAQAGTESGSESGGAKAHAMSGTVTAGVTARGASVHRVTLVTGDQVVVDAKGRVKGVEPAKSREKVPVQVYIRDGRTLVVPADAHRLLADGTLDQRLFDIGELDKTAKHRGRNADLPVIIGYRGRAATMKAEVRDVGDAQKRRTLKALNADAVTVAQHDATKLWNTLTDEARSGARTTAPGVAHVWLDGIRKAGLDKSVPQIGAPRAWAAGYDGKGVKVAVLDTGVDATHPDLKTQVVAQKNFSESPDTKDRVGHGTHVASTVAGTGAKSNGKYKGVAPGAKILNGKVLGDDGSGTDSGIIAGMEWAAEQGAAIVNMSLGGPDSPALDPMEAAVNKLSAEKGILFAIAAGNAGPGPHGTMSSPGSADAALTVGAVDDKDKLADFSSVGPRIGDGAVKPDVTAPGVDITAAAVPGSVIAREVGQNPPGYMSISGTSMATPHVAGAAAIVKQVHPDWTYTELKSALTGSAKDGRYSVFQQGAGRIQVDKAIKQSLIADPSSVNFGTQQWPHADDTPVTRKLTYRNLGKTDVTLKLAATATDPKGQAAPSGFFKLGATTVTVPAGGEASVDLTVNTKLGGTTDGAYSAYVTATGGGQAVRTAVSVNREIASYDVTLKYIGRDGKPASAAGTGSQLNGTAGLASQYMDFPAPDASGTAKLRVPKGTYLLTTQMYEDPEDGDKGGDWIVQPKLDVTKDTTVTIDARTTKPVDVTVPDTGAEPADAVSFLRYQDEDDDIGVLFQARSFKNTRTAHLGPQVPRGMIQQWVGVWEKGTSTQYATVSGGPVKKFATGYAKHFTAGQFATVKAAVGAAAPGKTGVVMPSGYLPSTGLDLLAWPQRRKLPAQRTLRLSTADNVGWTLGSIQYEGAEPGTEVSFSQDAPQTYRAGRTYQETFGTGVLAPGLVQGAGVMRTGNSMTAVLPVYTDGEGHPGFSAYSSVRTTLHRNGVKIVDTDDPLEGTRQYEVPAAEARYKLTTSFKRSAKVGAISTRIDASWTFRSKKTGEETAMPLSTVRFRPALGLDSTAPAGRTQSIPVAVEGAAAGRNLKSLAVHASYDDGRTWRKLTVRNGQVSVKNPAKGKGIAFRAEITDSKGNTSVIAVHNAYLGK
ncbi:peptidase S8 [Streptomyces ipomoeae]|nr:peptidase S8 [Streptomyces ipomoeae]